LRWRVQGERGLRGREPARGSKAAWAELRYLMDRQQTKSGPQRLKPYLRLAYSARLKSCPPGSWPPGPRPCRTSPCRMCLITTPGPARVWHLGAPSAPARRRTRTPAAPSSEQNKLATILPPRSSSHSPNTDRGQLRTKTGRGGWREACVALARETFQPLCPEPVPGW